MPALFTGQLAGLLLTVTVKRIQRHGLLELKAGIHGRFRESRTIDGPSKMGFFTRIQNNEIM